MVKIALVIPCEGFIENASNIFQQHNEYYRHSSDEIYTMEEIIVTSENSHEVKIDADIILTRGFWPKSSQVCPATFPLCKYPYQLRIS
ncbi:hypothetical protein [Clostridium sp. AM58-1XD]|uniref:hypothetical protein n=1 Tax=Clostridium sp. AM58-1XD TaxID=2292307 RepID=UPI001FA876C3|nr:hypothetical protein [Clostridium sp. AM58-1XD]